ncbi:ANGPT2 [Branchiostoma lanceolatum]|uniref:ANGPT2 protein n=1 Tax=Branchiostoma lanceolatum TaxID=7740 RepID=A0A8J9VHJ5_BRALA|nr:ANGPT2 [Branchiostoma lanceolatum]
MDEQTEPVSSPPSGPGNGQPSGSPSRSPLVQLGGASGDVNEGSGIGQDGPGESSRSYTYEKAFKHIRKSPFLECYETKDKDLSPPQSSQEASQEKKSHQEDVGSEGNRRHGDEGLVRLQDRLGDSSNTYKEAEVVYYTIKDKDIPPPLQGAQRQAKSPQVTACLGNHRRHGNKGVGRSQEEIEETTTYEEAERVYYTIKDKDIPLSQLQQSGQDVTSSQSGVATEDSKRQDNPTDKATVRQGVDGHRGLRDVILAHRCHLAAALAVVVILVTTGVLLLMLVRHTHEETPDVVIVPTLVPTHWSTQPVTYHFDGISSVQATLPAGRMTSSVPARPPPVTSPPDDVPSVQETLPAGPMTSSVPARPPPVTSPSDDVPSVQAALSAGPMTSSVPARPAPVTSPSDDVPSVQATLLAGPMTSRPPPVTSPSDDVPSVHATLPAGLMTSSVPVQPPPVTSPSDDVPSVQATLGLPAGPMTSSVPVQSPCTLSSKGDRVYAPGKYRDCAEVYDGGSTASGIYRITMQNNTRVDVYCEMDTGDGGWTVIQRRCDGTVRFDRTWTDYKRGFGNKTGEHWLGNDIIHLLTNQKCYRLWLDWVDGRGRRHSYICTPGHFRVADEKNGYRLDPGAPETKGNVCDHYVSYLSGFAFSTLDRDNDGVTNQSVYHTTRPVGPVSPQQPACCVTAAVHAVIGTAWRGRHCLQGHDREIPHTMSNMNISKILKRHSSKELPTNRDLQDLADVLCLAAKRGDVMGVIKVLDSGASANAANRMGVLPMWAAVDSDAANIQVIRYLLSRGADVQIRNKNGETLLRVAGLRQIDGCDGHMEIAM